MNAHCHPYAAGDGCICEQFAALPAGAEANYDRCSEFYFDPPFVGRYRSLAHCYYAQTRADYYRKLDFSSCVVRVCCRLLVRLHLFVCGNGRITSLWHGPGHHDLLGIAEGGTIKRTTMVWSGDRVRRAGCTGFSWVICSANRWSFIDDRRGYSLGNLFAPRQRRR